jgi:hypothetical protein
MNKWYALLHSRRFWLSVSGVLVVVLEHVGAEVGIEVDPQAAEHVVLIIAALVLGQSLRSTPPRPKPEAPQPDPCKTRRAET